MLGPFLSVLLNPRVNAATRFVSSTSRTGPLSSITPRKKRWNYRPMTSHRTEHHDPGQLSQKTHLVNHPSSAPPPPNPHSPHPSKSPLPLASPLPPPLPSPPLASPIPAPSPPSALPTSQDFTLRISYKCYVQRAMLCRISAFSNSIFSLVSCFESLDLLGRKVSMS